MGRETSPYIVGDFWLDKRADSDRWQIFWYDRRRRTTRSISAGTGELERAKERIREHALTRSKPHNADPKDVLVAHILASYWNEHGKHVASRDQIRASIQHWGAFLFRDEEKMNRGATKVADINQRLLDRFIEWRSGRHEYIVERRGKRRTFSSDGVTGDAVGRNIDDLRAAVRWAYTNGDIMWIPFIPAVKQEMRSGPRELILTRDQIRAIVQYGNPRIRRLAIGIVATLARPEAVMAWDITKQPNYDLGIFDTNPPGKRQTKKYNPVVPLINPFADYLKSCNGTWIEACSVKTAWRTMRTNLGLPQNTFAKTIRHSLITELQRSGVPEIEIETIAGHRSQTTTRKHYTHYRPEYLAAARSVLTDIFLDICGTVAERDGGDK